MDEELEGERDIEICAHLMSKRSKANSTNVNTTEVLSPHGIVYDYR